MIPYGLTNPPQAQQRLMDLVLGPQLEPFVFIYLDDVIIVTPNLRLTLRFCWMSSSGLGGQFIYHHREESFLSKLSS